MKIAAIWLFGMFGCAVTGGLLGEMIDPAEGASLGLIAGAFLFLCLRVFLPEQSAK